MHFAVYDSDGFECLIDFLRKISQVLGTNGTDDRFFLLGQSKCLTKISIRQCLFGLPEQCCAELVADDRRCKQAMQA